MIIITKKEDLSPLFVLNIVFDKGIVIRIKVLFDVSESAQKKNAIHN